MRILENEIEQITEKLGKHFYELFPKNMPMQTVLDACSYSLLAGGKRLRPFLLLEFCKISGGDVEKAIPFALAVEMIHTYSLIHDDLPAMDNDDFRRGKLTNHKVFGEAMAILAGDGLLNLAFETALTANFPPERVLQAVQELARASGIYGMVGGQTIDIENEQNKKKPTAEELLYMHSKKTGALIEASCKIGAILAGSGDFMMQKALEYGQNLGLTFQITDDILDVLGDFQTLGKTVHKDENSEKTTFIDLYGMDESQKQAKMYSEKACDAVIDLENSEILVELAKSLIDRKK